MLPSSLILRDVGRSNMQDHSPEYRITTDMFILYARDHSTKIYSLLTFSLSFLHDWFLSFFLSFFYLYTTIRQKYMVFFHLYFLLCMAIWQKYMVFFHLFFLLCTIIWLKIKVHTDLFLYMYTTIRKVTVLISWFILFAQDHSILFHLFFL